MKKINILAILILVGIIAHYKSFNLALHGDDWMHIFNFNTPDQRGFFSPLPGILKFLSPYGFSILLMGNLYNVLNTQYQFYFILALICKIFSAFTMYLVCYQISLSVKDSTKYQVSCLLISILYLVGSIGIQNTDWVFYMSIYIASGFFLISLYFYLRFYKNFNIYYLSLNLLFIIISMITGTVRLFPLIVVIPIDDIYHYFNIKERVIQRKIVFKFLIFIIAVIFLWAGGLFGSSTFGVYEFGGWSLNKFLQLVINNPLRMAQVLLSWIGITVLPDTIISNDYLSIVLGLVVLFIIIIFLFKGIINYKKHKLHFLINFQFLTFTLLTWYFLPTTIIGSSHRYLFLIFTCFCLWLFLLLYRFKLLFLAIISILIVINLISLQMVYNNLLLQGRSSNYIKKVDLHILEDFSHSMSKGSMIYFDTDSEPIRQSMIFGLPFKILVFNKIWDGSYYPDIYISKEELLQNVKSMLALDRDLNETQVINKIYGYRISNNSIVNISVITRKDIENSLLFSK